MHRPKQDRDQSEGDRPARRPLDPEERQRQRQLLAERIGRLLARHWLRSRRSRNGNQES